MNTKSSVKICDWNSMNNKSNRQFFVCVNNCVLFANDSNLIIGYAWKESHMHQDTTRPDHQVLEWLKRIEKLEVRLFS